MLDMKNIKPGLSVNARAEEKLGNKSGTRVATVDRLEGDHIKLTSTDSKDGSHHWIPLSWVDKCDNNAVYLNKTEDEFFAEQIDEQPQEVRSAS